MLAGTGADVDHPIRPLDGFLIVFDDNQRVAEVAQMVQRLDETRVVTLVQSDRWLVEHVHDADQAGADLRGESDALRFSAGQGGGRAREGQVVEADVVQEAESGLDLLEHFAGDQLCRASSFRPLIQASSRTTGMSHTSKMDFPSTVTASTSGFRRRPWQTWQGTSRMYDS